MVLIGLQHPRERDLTAFGRYVLSLQPLVLSTSPFAGSYGSGGLKAGKGEFAN
jgi:hypothetical protein